MRFYSRSSFFQSELLPRKFLFFIFLFVIAQLRKKSITQSLGALRLTMSLLLLIDIIENCFVRRNRRRRRAIVKISKLTNKRRR